MTSTDRPPAPDRVDEDAAAVAAGDVPRGRRLAAGAATAGAITLVLLALVTPSRLGRVAPEGFLRLPVEGLLAAAGVLVLPSRWRRAAVILIGVLFGLLGIMKILDLGFFAVLDRPFDPVNDWSFLDAATVFVSQSIGWGGAVLAVAGAVLIAAGVLVLTVLSVRRLARLAAGHRTGTARGVAVLGVAWVVLAALGVHTAAGAPLAARDSYDHALGIQAGMRDRKAFAAELAVDAFRDTPGDRLLTALRGKDVIVAFIESYGRVAVEDPLMAPSVGAVLDSGNGRLRAAGYASRSAYLTSPTAGGGSWLAHATLMSGLWINNQARYHDLLASDRLTLNGAFRRASWRTVAVMPAVTQPWPEGEFFGCDRIYAARDLGYHGPRYSFATMPDQYTLAAFERAERSAYPGPLMADIPLISSHAPWTPVPRLIDWDDVGDGSAFQPAPGFADPPEVTLRRNTAQVRADYRRSIEYSLNTLISYVEAHGDDDLVLVFLGDHQPAPTVTGQGASRDVPISIVTRDRGVLDRVAAWGWQDGLNPGSRAPVWRMDTFRDRFLAAFGPGPGPTP